MNHYLLYHKNKYERSMAFEQIIHGVYHRQAEKKAKRKERYAARKRMEDLFASIENDNPEMKKYAFD